MLVNGKVTCLHVFITITDSMDMNLGKGQGSLARSSPWGCKVSVTEQQQQNYLFCGQMKQVHKVLSTESGLW